MSEQFLDALLEKDDITWQSLITDLIKSEKMDPWNIDVSLLTQKYIEIVRKLHDHDFRLSGKIVLAAAILLKIKSTRLIGEDLSALDRMFMQDENNEIESEWESNDYVDPYIEEREKLKNENPELIPHTPQPRKRKVSIYDLMKALEQALEVKKRKMLRDFVASEFTKLPEKKYDIGELIEQIYSKIDIILSASDKTKFSKIVQSDNKESKILTFIPLLHLANQKKIQIWQNEHLGDIEIYKWENESILSKEYDKEQQHLKDLRKAKKNAKRKKHSTEISGTTNARTTNNADSEDNSTNRHADTRT